MLNFKGPISITHVKQMHMPHGFDHNNVGAEMIEILAYSQYQVAQIILANPNSIVVAEGLYEDYEPAGRKNMGPILFVINNAIFPHGLPAKFSDLKRVQKEFLAQEDGAKSLFGLGKLTHIHKSLTKEDNKKINKKLKAGDFSVVGEDREFAALRCAKEAAIKRNNPNVLLIFGGAHRFDLAIQKLNDPEITFNTSIDTESAHLVKAFEEKSEAEQKMKEETTEVPAKKPSDINDRVSVVALIQKDAEKLYTEACKLFNEEKNIELVIPKFISALELFEKKDPLQRNSGLCHSSLASCYRRLNEPAKAIEHVNKAIGILKGPDKKKAQKKLADLEEWANPKKVDEALPQSLPNLVVGS